MNIDLWSFLLGIFSSIIIPGITFIIKYFSNMKAKNDFIKLIMQEYVEPIVSVSFESVSEYEYKDRLRRLSWDNCSNLTYLKENELTHLTTENQFYFLRVVEYTLALQKNIQDISNKYDFQDMPVTDTNYNKALIRRAEVLNEIESYEENVKKYAKLKIDKFVKKTPN